jgi:hypothetical protein
MSAYLFGTNEIAVVAKICKEAMGCGVNGYRHPYNCITKKELNWAEFETILAAENIRSLEFRYPRGGVAGGFLNGEQERAGYYADLVEQTKDRAAIKIPDQLDDRVAEINRYEYQACECNDFHESDAYWILANAKERILARYVKLHNEGQVEQV